MKKVMLLCVVLLLCLSVFGIDKVLGGEDYKDTELWAREHRQNLMGKNITDGSNPKGNVQRQELWAMLDRYIGTQDKENLDAVEADKRLDSKIEEVDQRLTGDLSDLAKAFKEETGRYVPMSSTKNVERKYDDTGFYFPFYALGEYDFTSTDENWDAESENAWFELGAGFDVLFVRLNFYYGKNFYLIHDKLWDSQDDHYGVRIGLNPDKCMR